MSTRPQDLLELKNADYDALVEIFDELSNNLINSKFLSESSFLKNNAANLVDEQYSKRPIERKKKLSHHVGQYIAASALLHNMDGWKYLGNAINSLLKGDISIAKHLLYYSELRACMSFLASNGIGVFNNRHLLINNKKKVIEVNRRITNNERSNIQGTHVFSWDAFNQLRNEDEFLKRIFDNFHIDGFMLSDWLDKFGVNPSFLSNIARKLLDTLSFDLNQFKKDRDVRNDSSYRPNNIFENETIFINETLNEIRNIWKISKPLGGQGEINIDLMLLTEILQISFKSTHPFGRSFRNANKQYNKRLKIMLNSFGLSEFRKNHLLKLFNNSNADVFDHISNQDVKSDKFIIGMLYRSFIFLRLSNNYVKNIINKTQNIDKDSLSFWWNPLGINTGLWQENYEPENFEDLWDDINQAIEESEFEELHPNYTTNELWHKFSSFGFLFGTCNRIGLWGLGI